MRKIIFRGKNLKTGEWVDGGLYEEYGSIYIRKKTDYPNDIYFSYAVDTETVSEFTGLADKNGKEIYEGDILNCKEFVNNGDMFPLEDREVVTLDDLRGELRNVYISAVMYDEANFYIDKNDDCQMPLACFFGDQRYSYPIFEIEIIGNIYDNPELLK